MKTLVFLLAVVIGAYFWLNPHVEPHRVYRVDDLERMARGWEVLQPWAAWPVLAAYGAPLIVFICGLAWIAGMSSRAEERQRLAGRQAAAEARMQEARRLQDEGEAMQQEAREALERAAKREQEAARREQEAATRIEAAEFRMQRSVNTNIGLHQQVKKLRERLNGQGE